MFETLRDWFQNRGNTRVRRTQAIFKPKLEALEDRLLLDNDLLIWNPKDGTNLASHAANWYDASKQLQGVEAPGFQQNGGQGVWLDTYYSNAPIVWDQNVTLAGLTLTGGAGAQPGPGYTGLQTINAGVSVYINGGIGWSGSPLGQLNIEFLGMNSGANSANLYDLAQTTNVWRSFNLTVGAGSNLLNDNVFIAGQVQMDYQSGDTQTTQVPISVTSGALYLQPNVAGNYSTLTLQNGATLNATGSDSAIAMNDLGSSMTFVQGDGWNNVAILGEFVGAYYNAEISVNIGNGCFDSCLVPVANFGAGFYLNGPGSSNNSFSISGSMPQPAYPSCSYYAEAESNAGAYTYLIGGANLVLSYGYFQDDATGKPYPSVLKTGDDLAESITANNNGIYIGNNTSVSIDPGDPNGFGTLNCMGNVNMKGNLDLWLNGQTGQHADWSVSGAMYWTVGSSITVYIIGGLTQSWTWGVIQTSGGIYGMSNIQLNVGGQPGWSLGGGSSYDYDLFIYYFA